MNLLEATVVGQRRRLASTSAATRLPIADQALQQLPAACASYDGRKVIVGLRAGDLHPRRAGTTCRRSRARSSSSSRSAASRWRTSRSTRGLQERDAVDEEEVLETDGEARSSSARGRTWSRRSRRMSSCGSATRSRSRSTRENLHFFDEATGAPLR